MRETGEDTCESRQMPVSWGLRADTDGRVSTTISPPHGLQGRSGSPGVKRNEAEGAHDGGRAPPGTFKSCSVWWS